ncbi:MAG: 16S rRNA (cytosine(967)-C(5))-methyltransferase RsmB [Firmicutes bacterium]|nr:16S rRNA (cytosine(967)-C(5))-methyltransferase RsmB [Bacillota bacterium]MDH7495624.1 16S rRNA (cytosine(967)-C(5))-methyltransferase RsmB [Bacillota bacterium]
MDAVCSARGAALRALMDIDERGAYAAIARDRALKVVRLSERDRALATELVYGVTKMRKALDHAIGAFAARPVERMDAVVRNALRLGAYQVLYLSQVPAPSAVSEAVELARAFGHEGAGAFVNAVLRALVGASGKIDFPDAADEPVDHIAVRYSHPEWMVSRWVHRFGFEETARLCAANNESPPVTIRVNALKTSRERLLSGLVTAGFDARPSPYVPEAVEVCGGAGLFSHESYANGEFLAQDQSSMLASYVLDPLPGERVLDIAAAPGGKTTHIAERMGDQGEIVAADVHAHRVRLLQENARRLGVRSIKAVVLDATDPQAFAAEATSRPFDRALVDPPCTGTGVLRRRPDLRWRRSLRDISDLAVVQARLLAAAAAVVKPGGIVVYSTCSIEPEENGGIVEGFLREHPGFSLEPAAPYLPREFVEAFPGQGLPYVETFPHIHAMDGFFIARLARRPEP